MRRTVPVRDIVPADLPRIAELAIIGRGESGVASQICSDDPDHLINQLGTLVSLPGGRILVTDDEPSSGFVALRMIEPNLFTTETSVFIEAIFVDPAQRRRGIGRSLLNAVAEVAEQNDAHHVYSVQIPGTRGVQRFLARLGFAPVAGHRSVPTAVLIRRLGSDLPETGGIKRHSIEELIARRRKVRQEAHTA